MTRRAAHGVSVALAAATLAVAIAACGESGPTCTRAAELPSAARTVELPIAQTTPADVAALAQRYEPTVKMSALDRFWPISVATVLAERDRQGGGVKLMSGANAVVTDSPTLASLGPSRDTGAYLDYPAGLADKGAQMRVLLRGLGVPEHTIEAWPTDLSPFVQKSAQIYFYDAGTSCSVPGHEKARYRALEYWFFYALNYYPMTVDTPTMLAAPLRADDVDTDLHEGDWEHMTVLLDEQNVPRFVWMARHSSEGKLIPWDQVQRDPAGHPVVYPAFGGHPSYPTCGGHPRALLAAAVYDYVVCTGRLYTLSGAATRLVDLASVRWSCWPGYFGTTAGTSASSNADDPTGQILAAGPRSPLLQAENKNVCREPPATGKG